MRSPTYDVVLLPPREVAAESIAVSGRLAPLGCFALRDAGTAIPHLSLYISPLRASDLLVASERLAQVATAIPALPLRATRHARMPDGFVEIQYERTPLLVRLQEEVLAAINPLRDGLPDETPAGVPTADAIRLATTEERGNFETWGYPECGPLFRPHISFTRLRDPHGSPDLNGLPAADEFSGTFSRLALCTMGPHGTCPAVVGEWGLIQS